jgi:LPXTG-site transpeptidase (sortase) family protein
MSFIKDAGPLRKVFLGLGAVTFLGGASLLGYVGYSAIQGDEEERPPVRQVDLGETSTPTVAPTSPVTGTATPPPVAPLGDQPYTMIIPKLGVDAPVDEYGLDDNAIPEVPEGDDAADVVAWYNFSARPGEGSNAVFAGHVTWFGAAVFYNLTTMAAGDEIRLKGQDGTEMLYRVSETFQVDPQDADSLDVMKATPSDMMTIITCDGAYSDTNDPVYGGEYSHRFVVRAVLESVTPGAAVGASGG